MGIITRGFFGRRRQEEEDETAGRVPPGQYVDRGFPVLSAGPTPRVDTATWTFRIDYNGEDLGVWDWDQMMALPQTDIHTDIHCVTKWSKLDTDWRGVLIDDFLADAGIDDPPEFMMVYSDGGYTTNLPTADVIDGKGFLGHTFDDAPSNLPTAAPSAWSSPTSTSGNQPSGSAASASWTPTPPASGKPTATTCTATRGASSDYHYD